MANTGIFVTPEELEAVKTALSCSGMFLSGGRPMGDAQFEVEQLCKKYNLDKSHGLNVKTGEFVKTMSSPADLVPTTCDCGRVGLHASDYECIQWLLAELKEARETNVFTAAFAEKLKDFGTIDRLIESYSASKMECRNLETEIQAATAALRWIATVNESLDLRKMDQKTLIGLLHELRGKAKAACTA